MKISSGFKLWILCAVMAASLCGLGGIQAEASQEDAGYLYVTDSGSAYSYIIGRNELHIVQYHGTEEHVVIPAEIDGMAVAGIRANAFSYAEIL